MIASAPRAPCARRSRSGSRRRAAPPSTGAGGSRLCTVATCGARRSSPRCPRGSCTTCGCGRRPRPRRRRHRQVDRDRLQRGREGLRTGERVPRPVRTTGGRPRRSARSAPQQWTVRSSEPGQLAGEVLDVDARAAVDLRRVLAREQGDAHGQAIHRRALADHDDAAGGDDEALAVGAPGRRRPARPARCGRSCRRSRSARPRRGRPRPRASGPSPRRAARESTWTPGDSTERRTVAARDDDAGADHRVERHARAAGSSNTNLAGGSGSSQRQDRPVVVVEVEDRIRPR